MLKHKTTTSPAQNLRRRTDNAPNPSDEIFKKGEIAFYSLFEDILVKDPAPIEFAGSISHEHMTIIWKWLFRDVAPELNQIIVDTKDKQQLKQALASYCPKLAEKISVLITKATSDTEINHQLISQLNGEEVKNRLPTVCNALRCQPLIEKASAFGRAANSIEEEETLGAALQSMPLQEPAIASLLFHAIVGQSKTPSRLISSIVQITGASSEAALIRAGFLPLLEAILAHSQNQIAQLSCQVGIYIDADLMCKTILRFHSLMRAITGFVELERHSRLGKIATNITMQMAKIIEPRLREVSADVSQSLRKPRNGQDRIDQDLLLSALNGMYILGAVRKGKESLALNATFDKVWSETGQALEILIDRNLEDYKNNIKNDNIAQRLDMGIKMAKIRFGDDYARTLQNAKEKIAQRINEQQ